MIACPSMLHRTDCNCVSPGITKFFFNRLMYNYPHPHKARSLDLSSRHTASDFDHIQLFIAPGSCSETYVEK